MRSHTSSLIVAILFTSYVSQQCHANDSGFIGASGILTPLMETRIRIQREWLTFDLTKDHAEIRVRFHFFNPEDTAIELPVGFYIDRGSGDVSFSDIHRPAVDHFTTTMNGVVLPYDVKIQQCDTCALVDTTGVFAEEIAEDDPNMTAFESSFVFLSKMRFLPGVNVVTHSYRQRPSSSIATPAEYDYWVRTASRWAGGKIDTLECEFSAPRDMMCYVKGAHGAQQTYLIGSAREYKAMQLDPYVENINLPDDSPCPKVIAPNGDVVTNDHRRLFRLRDARVRFTWIDFRAGQCDNFTFTLLEIYRYLLGKDRALSAAYAMDDSTQFIDQQRLRIARNALYAIHGLTFKDPELQSYFNKQEWYIADPNLRASEILLTKEEQALLKELSP